MTDEYYMNIALKEAEKAADEGEIPVGAVIVCNNKIIAKAHNMVEKLKDSTAHAEILAITSAETVLQSKYLDNCTIYITVEPCVMCAGAIHWAHIKKVVYATTDPKKGYTLYSTDILKNSEIVKGIGEAKASSLIKNFFKLLRKNKL
jgi:tRNA(adenine34) deaminase